MTTPQAIITVQAAGLPGPPAAATFTATGLTGATGGARWVGSTTSGAPVSGTFLLGDWITTDDGHVWICTTAGSPGTWTSISGGGGSLPLTTLGDTLYENATPAPARLPGNTTATKNFLTQTGTGSASAAPGWGTIAAGDVPQLADYAPTGLTGATAASRYVGATTSGAPGSGTFVVGDFVIDQSGKVWICTTGGTPGTWTAAGPTIPVPIASGGTGQQTQQTALDALAGVTTSGDYLRGNGSHVVMAAIQAGDVPTLNQNTSGTASNITDTLDQVPAPAANVSLNGHKITSVANGGSAQDVAAFGQIPVADSTASDIQPLGALAVAGNNGKWADSGHVHPNTGVAPLASPAFTGTPTAPTGAAGDASTQIATDAFVAASTAYFLRVFAV